MGGEVGGWMNRLGEGWMKGQMGKGKGWAKWVCELMDG